MLPGFEPGTFALSARRTTNCAIAPLTFNLVIFYYFHDDESFFGSLLNRATKRRVYYLPIFEVFVLGLSCWSSTPFYFSFAKKNLFGVCLFVSTSNKLLLEAKPRPPSLRLISQLSHSLWELRSEVSLCGHGKGFKLPDVFRRNWK